MNGMYMDNSRIVLLFLILLVVFGHAATALAAIHNIEATAGVGGRIEPNGTVSVSNGANAAFTITPDEDHVVSNITVDDISMGAASRYTIYCVKRDSRLRASFLPEANAAAETIYVDNTLASD
ncbi:MAG: hypothetical protein ACYTE3_30285, partial [Planctomycetota bacterium]